MPRHSLRIMARSASARSRSCIGYLATQGITYEVRAPVWVVVLEVPAILAGVVLARGFGGDVAWKPLLRELLLGRSIVLLLGGLAIGWISGPEGTASIQPLFFGLFKGILALFLLEMGLIAATQLGALRRNAVFLVLFGVLMPLFGAVVGAVLGRAIGLSAGGITRARDACRERVVHRGTHGDAHRRTRGQSGAVADGLAGHHLPVQHHHRHPAL